MLRATGASALAFTLTLTLVAACGAQGEDAPSEADAAPSAAAEPTSTPTGAAPSPSASTARPPTSAIPPPTLGVPSGPPKMPTDYRSGDIIAGRIVRGGPGPCYGLVDDDDKMYAIYSRAGLVLEEGTYIRAKITTLKLKIYCGEGEPVAAVDIKRLN